MGHKYDLLTYKGNIRYNSKKFADQIICLLFFKLITRKGKKRQAQQNVGCKVHSKELMKFT